MQIPAGAFPEHPFDLFRRLSEGLVVPARETDRVSLERPLTELELGKRPTDALANADILTVGQVLEKMAGGEAGMLAIDGFGRKSLADLKKRLRQFGYELPEAMDEILV